jgi:hypothetical protein
MFAQKTSFVTEDHDNFDKVDFFFVITVTKSRVSTKDNWTTVRQPDSFPAAGENKKIFISCDFDYLILYLFVFVYLNLKSFYFPQRLAQAPITSFS